MAWPRKTGPSPDSIRPIDDQIVVSVGPYIFQRELQRVASLLAKSRERASPPQRILKVPLPFHPASSSSRQVAGVACIIVAPLSAITFINLLPSAAASRPAITSLAPAINGRNNSMPAISKESVVTATNTSPSAVRRGSFCIAQSRLAKARCSTCTPLGSPVEPEV